MSVAIVGDDELDSAVQDGDNIEYISSNSSSHPSTSSSNNIAVGVLIGVVDDDENDGIIVTNLQQETGVDSMYYDWTREEINLYPACCFDAIDKILYWARMGTEQDSEYA